MINPSEKILLNNLFFFLNCDLSENVSSQCLEIVCLYVNVNNYMCFLQDAYMLRNKMYRKYNCGVKRVNKTLKNIDLIHFKQLNLEVNVEFCQ